MKNKIDDKKLVSACGLNYKIGEKVKVKKDLIVGKTYGNWNGWVFTKDMADMRGKTVEIEKLFFDAYIIKEDNGLHGWTEDMFELNEKEKK